MDVFATPVAKLIEEFEKLPGIGHKTAQRLTFHVLNLPKEKVEELAKANENVKKFIDGMNVVKIIVVPNKIVNIVVK